MLRERHRLLATRLATSPTSSPCGPIREGREHLGDASLLLGRERSDELGSDWRDPQELGWLGAATGEDFIYFLPKGVWERGDAPPPHRPSQHPAPLWHVRSCSDWEAGPSQVSTNTLTTSKVAYFKRKYAEEEEDLHQDYQGYFPKHLILPEDRTCILKLSLQKLQFLEDPEIYLRRSVLINNLLRKIHLETERERYEYFKGSPCCRTAYADARKRLKFVVQECHSQSLYYEELHSYHIVPYPTENAIYRVGYSSSHLEQNSQLLIYKMK